MSVNLTFTTLGELIRSKREEKGISLSEVSRVTGISKGLYQKSKQVKQKVQSFEH
ncbi:helix-turn-helix domain-containing protein [Brevibacillus laterosporus]